MATVSAELSHDRIIARINAGEVCVALEEEYGYRYWVWFPGMDKDQLAQWWKSLASVRDYWWNPSDNLPGEIVPVCGGESWFFHTLREDFDICTSHLHTDGDSYLVVPGIGEVLHQGYDPHYYDVHEEDSTSLDNL